MEAENVIREPGQCQAHVSWDEARISRTVVSMTMLTFAALDSHATLS